MKKKILYALAALLIALSVFIVPTVWFKPWSIDHFYTRTFLHFALQRPMMLSSLRILEPMGIDFHNDDLDDVSMAFAQREAKWLSRQLRILRSYDRESMDADERLSYDVLEWFMVDAEQANAYMFHNYPVNQMAGIQSGLPDFMINTHQIGNEGEARDYVARLNQFGRFFSQVNTGLRHRASIGVIPPRFVFEKVLDEVRAFVAHPVAEHPLFVHFKERVEESVPEARREDLLESARSAIADTVYPAYREVIACLEEIQVLASTDDGVWKFPDGEAFYAYQLRHHTTTDMSPDEIHALGLTEIERIQAEIADILTGQGIAFDQVGAALMQLGKEERFLYPDTEDGRAELLRDYQALIDEISAGIDSLFDKRPKAPVEVVPVPHFKEATATVAYYDAPAFDGSRPGRFYVNLRSIEEHAKFGMPTLAYHEAVPGHHFQIAMAQEMTDVPFFRKVIPFTAYTEGWALYAELLAAEAGFEDDPFDRLGYLQAQLFRAVRLVVDTGIHHKRWTREEAIDYMLRQTGMAESDVVAEIERYIVNPGQACAYKVGQLKILALREKAEAALGSSFDIRAFHNIILGNGALPLTILEKQVDRWIADVEPAVPPHPA